jgi:hypothetical protein
MLRASPHAPGTRLNMADSGGQPRSFLGRGPERQEHDPGMQACTMRELQEVARVVCNEDPVLVEENRREGAVLVAEPAAIANTGRLIAGGLSDFDK